ncbi:MAG: ATP-grasp domain-containing protein, partial [Gemmatimonadales bacterium]
GHDALVFEADMTLLNELKAFMPPDRRTGWPTGLVFNMAYGIQGEARYTHVPGMLEMAGVPYTGATPLGHAVSLDKVISKVLMQQASVPTPAFVVMRDPHAAMDNLRFPLVVKPRRESTSNGLRVARNRAELADAVTEVVTNYPDEEALVEEFIAGRELCVGLLGNDPVHCLPLVELDFGDRALPTFTWDDKYHKSADEPQRICPAAIDEATRRQLEEVAIATFRACHCRDYARVDIRLDERGTPYVLEINSMTSLGLGGSFLFAARQAGYTFDSLVCRILDLARAR